MKALDLLEGKVDDIIGSLPTLGESEVETLRKMGLRTIAVWNEDSASVPDINSARFKSVPEEVRAVLMGVWRTGHFCHLSLMYHEKEDKYFATGRACGKHPKAGTLCLVIEGFHLDRRRPN